MAWQKFRRWLRHSWMDTSSTRRVVPPQMLERLRQGVAQSEQRHTGQVRLCVEASLPHDWLWRYVWQGEPLARVVRERAVAMFSTLRVWDTEGNNGVLIYLLLAERAIEIVADRGVSRRVAAPEWAAMVRQLGSQLQAGHHEAGLAQALAGVSAVLQEHFPRTDGVHAEGNELPDEPVLM